ncbi:MAG: hypothetical protein PHC68_09495 [Syntrophorhabdaceae bacterium]|nr:hypothetical protein [Syntrophorhabdaceae bacterium]
MGNIIFELAGQSDNGEISDIVAGTSMEGPISVSFERRPDFRKSVLTGYESCQVMVAREKTSGRIIACGCRTIRKMYVNGCIKDVGYISNLRILEGFRGGSVLARGYSFLNKLHSDGKAGLYLTTIIEGNDSAESILASGRRSLPVYSGLGTYRTYVIRAGRNMRVNRPGIQIESGDRFRPCEIVEFLNREGPRRQFYPHYTEGDFDNGVFSGMGWRDFIVAHKDGKIKGVIGAWDQKGFKRIRIKGYNRKLSMIRPIWNAFAGAASMPRLPDPGEFLGHLNIGFVAVDSDDRSILDMLIRYANDAAHGKGYTHIMVGLHDRDPMSAVVRRFRHIAFNSKLYVVFWEDGREFYEKLDNRIPYLESGVL